MQSVVKVHETIPLNYCKLYLYSAVTSIKMTQSPFTNKCQLVYFIVFAL